MNGNIVPQAMKLACDLAIKAGKLQLRALGKAHQISYKGDINIVTETDHTCEELIVRGIQKVFPTHDILAEEGHGLRQSSDYRWIVDPIDGTVNFAHGFPFFCVSIGLECDGEIVAGVIYDPNRDELFTAQKGKGAFCGRKKISVSKAAELRKSLLATGFAYNVQEPGKLDNLDHFASFIKTARAVRRPGSAAIDLAWVACGRLDGFWEISLKPWDMAAGVVIVREAGGKMSSFDGREFGLYGDTIVASNGVIHDQMINVLHNPR